MNFVPNSYRKKYLNLRVNARITCLRNCSTHSYSYEIDTAETLTPIAIIEVAMPFVEAMQSGSSL
jgi:hypothetical protein